MEALFRFFEPDAEYGVTLRQLPHWAQTKTLCFITWRTWDSMPIDVVKTWQEERHTWLTRHRIDIRAPHWMAQLQRLPVEVQHEYHRLFPQRWEALLDNCHGSCPMRDPALSKIVGDSLLFFDGTRYCMTDFVVMPNHVHVLVAFADAEHMLTQCDSWKHFTATQMNKKLGRKGRFWEPDAFDHLVRSEEQWLYLRDYVRENPIQAKLRPGEFLHYSKDLSNVADSLGESMQTSPLIAK